MRRDPLDYQNYIRFGDNALLPIPVEEALKLLLSPVSSGFSTESHERGLAELPLSWRERSRREPDEYRRSYPDSTAFTDRVRLRSCTISEYLVPDGGVTSVQSLPPSPWTAVMIGIPRPVEEKIEVPESLRAPLSAYSVRAVYLTARSEEEALEAVEQVKRAGMNALWLDVEERNGEKILNRAIEAGKREGITVVAVYSLLKPY